MSSFLPILIIKTGTTFPATKAAHGDFDDWMREQMQIPAERTMTIEVFRDQPLPDWGAFSGAVLTGSHSMASDREPWSEALAAWLRQAVEREAPLLGVCYGHQLLAQALGGEAGYHPAGPEMGTVEIALSEAGEDDELLGGLPKRFMGHATHYQTALTLPDEAVALASNAHEAHHAFRVGRRAWGAQFHPEFTAGVMRSYIQEQAGALRERGMDVDALLKNVTETPFAHQTLKRFAELAMEAG